MNLHTMDNYTMSDAADLWAPKDVSLRALFVRGWKDQRSGAKREELDSAEKQDAYNRGYAIALETPIAVAIDVFWKGARPSACSH